jgi:predicted DNA-binding protein
MPKIISGTKPRIRADFYLTMLQMERLRKLSRKTGLSASEILRRAIDEYWESQKESGRR